LTSYIFLGVSIAIGVFGQILLKYSTLNLDGYYIISPNFNKYFFVAAALYGVSIFFYAYSLRELPLHIAFPAVSLSYVFVALASSYLWNTPFGLREILALVLITMGIALLAGSAVEDVR